MRHSLAPTPTPAAAWTAAIREAEERRLARKLKTQEMVSVADSNYLTALKLPALEETTRRAGVAMALVKNKTECYGRVETPKILGGRRPVTVIVGILCKDALVVGSDSQESDQYMKRLDVKKIYDTKEFLVKDVELIVAGSGDSAYIRRVIELFDEHSYAPDFLWPRDFANVAEKSMADMQRRYGDALSLQVMFGVWGKMLRREMTDLRTDYIHCIRREWQRG